MTQQPVGTLSPASRHNGVDRAYAMLTRRTTRGIPLGHSGATENKGSRRAFDIQGGMHGRAARSIQND